MKMFLPFTLAALRRCDALHRDEVTADFVFRRLEAVRA